jgi:hypothetical protein
MPLTPDEIKAKRKRRRRLVWIVGGLFALLILGLWFATPSLVAWLAGPGDTQLEGRGQYGDAYGFANALFSGLAFVGVVIAILLQSNELEFQIEELSSSVAAQRDQADALNKQLEQNRSVFEQQREAVRRERSIRLYEQWMMLDRTGAERIINEFVHQKEYLALPDDAARLKHLQDYHNRLPPLSHLRGVDDSDYISTMQILSFLDQMASLQGDTDFDYLAALLGFEVEFWTTYFVQPFLLVEKEVGKDRWFIERLERIERFLDKVWEMNANWKDESKFQLEMQKAEAEKRRAEAARRKSPGGT